MYSCFTEVFLYYIQKTNKRANHNEITSEQVVCWTKRVQVHKAIIEAVKYPASARLPVA